MTVPTWYSDAPEPRSRLTPGDWPRVAFRGCAMAGLVFGGLAVLLALRAVEAPLYRHHRPWTPWITVAVCRGTLRILGLGHRVEGQPMRSHGALVANHVSWLDIFALNAVGPVYFVAKAEVSGWPGIGWLARATGTVFIERQRRAASEQRALLARRLDMGHRLVIFPEGTSTDGRRVLPFRTTLFAAVCDAPAAEFVQPVTLEYQAPEGERADFYGWWGDMTYPGDLARHLAQRQAGSVVLRFHPPLPAQGDRKTLARAAEEAVRRGLRHAAHDAPSP